MQANIKRLIRLLPLAACAALLYISPRSSAAETVWLRETLFLGEAVPLRVNGLPLEEQAAMAFGDEPGRVECWWMSPEGLKDLAELGRQRPRQEQLPAHSPGRKLPYPQPKDWGYGGF